MAIIARTVHLMHPETGELVTLRKGEEIPDDEVEEFKDTYNNPTIFDDPDATRNVDRDLASLSDEEFFFAADANGTVDPDNFEEQRDARRGAAEAGTGGVDFDITDYRTWKIGELREEYTKRKEAGEDLPEADFRSKPSLVKALSPAETDPDAGNS